MNHDCICVGCYADFESPTTKGMEWSGDEYDGRWVGLCPQCRADLELGRLVRVMKPGRVLTHAAKEDEIEPENPWESYSYVVEDGDCRFGGTPEEALKGAKQ